MFSNEFETIVEQNYEQLYRFALSLTRTAADATELTQQTFHVWATKGHQLRDRSKVKTWLFTTLHRAFLESRQKQSQFSHQRLDEIPLHAESVCSPDLACEADPAQLLGALAQIQNTAAVALFYLEDFSHQSIAEILQVPVGTAKSHIARGTEKLREIFLRDSCFP